MEPRRLDQYVVQQVPGISRAQAAKLIVQGEVTVNGHKVTKASFKLQPDDSVAVNFQPRQVVVEELELPILYEDDDCLVINKPVGVLAHSKSAYNPEATVASWLAPRLKGLSGERAGIVHRLDRATSGVMICAKTAQAQAWLQKQFALRRTKKTYEAVVKGRLTPAEAVIDMPIERNPKRPQTFRVGANGKSAVTVYRQVENGRRYSLLELKPETGRTHQLRVHLQKLGHPIVGDTLYGGGPADRLYLHAQCLEITLPNRRRQIFTTQTPASFLKRVQL